MQVHHNAQKSSPYDFGQIYWNPGDLHCFCQQRISPVLLGYHPQGDEIENALLVQACYWKCPELTIYKWRVSLHWQSAHEGTTTLHDPPPWCTEARSCLPSGSGTFYTPTELAQAVSSSHSELELKEVSRDLGLRNISVLTYLKMNSFGLYSTVELLVYFLLIQTLCGNKGL